jgi:coatomer subunit gamma
MIICASFQLEDVEVTVSDHVQKVLKPNWSASWEEIGADNELEDTYTLSIPTLEGRALSLVVISVDRFLSLRMCEEDHQLHGNASV